MFYLIVLVCSILNLILGGKSYILLFICLAVYMLSSVLKIYYDIDYSPIFIAIRYLLYMVFFYKFALEGRKNK